jgi:DNA-binding HxlR family transcriptional regulator
LQFIAKISHFVQQNRDNFHDLHIVSECFSPVKVALGLRKDFPLMELLNEKLQLLKEAGLVRKEEGNL